MKETSIEKPVQQSSEEIPEETVYLEKFRFALDSLENTEPGSIPILPMPDDLPQDIPAYFNDLEKRHLAIPHCDIIMMSMVNHVRHTLKELQRYNANNRKFYPQEDVRLSIDYLYDLIKYQSGHGNLNDSIPGITQSRNYLYQFIAITANLEYLPGTRDADRFVCHLGLTIAIHTR